MNISEMYFSPAVYCVSTMESVIINYGTSLTHIAVSKLLQIVVYQETFYSNVLPILKHSLQNIKNIQRKSREFPKNSVKLMN